MTISSRVYVVDDDSPSRESLTALLEESGFHVRAYSCARCFLDERARGDGECLVSDLKMPGVDGLALLRRLRSAGDDIPAILVTAYGDVPTTVEAMDLGALSVLEKPYEPRVLIDFVHKAVRKSTHRLRARSAREQAAELVESLSSREREVLLLLLSGQTTKQIASELEVKVRTAQLHRERVLEKAGVAEVIQLAPIADEIRSLMG